MKNLFKALWNKLRIADKKAADAVNDSDLVGNAEIIIEDSKEQIANFKRAIANAMQKNIQLKNQEKDAKEDSDKFQRIAALAVKAGSDDDAKEALMSKQRFDKMVQTLTEEIRKNDKIITSQREQLTRAESKVQSAENNKDILAVRLEGADARIGLAGSSVLSQDGLSQLDELENQVEAREARAEALEELEGVNKVSLEEKYSSNNVSIEDELAKLKAAVA